MSRKGDASQSVDRSSVGPSGLLAAACITLLVCPLASAQDRPQRPAGPVFDRPLMLKAGNVSTAIKEESLLELAVKHTAKDRAVLQLDGPMTPGRRANLEDAGIDVGEYLPPHSYIVRLDKADRAKLQRLDFVRWQSGFKPEWKLDPDIGIRDYKTAERQDETRKGRVHVLIHLFDDTSIEDATDALMGIPGIEIGATDIQPGMTTIAASMLFNDTVLLADIPEVKFIEDAPENTERSNTNDRWIVQSNLPGVTPLYDAGIRGEGQIIGILDSAVNVNHCSFFDTNPIGPTHRKILVYNATQGSASHGTHVAGTVAGDNGVDDDTRGVAYLSKFVFNLWPSGSQNEPTITALLSQHYGQGARIHTNSWGDDGTTAYTGQCRGIDNHTYTNEDSLVLFAATNTTALKTPENAKNCLAVGASQGAGSQDNFCSGGTGPTNDGRRKPEIFAPGCSTVSASNTTSCGTVPLTGTSMACPAVAGAATLVRQYFTDGYYPSGAANPLDVMNPSAALIKAVLLNSAVDMTGISGYPSNQEGWGRVLADNALYFPGDSSKLWVRDIWNAQGLSTNELFEQGVNVISANQPFEVTLVWTDPPAAASTTFAAINDLDLEVVGPGGMIYLGNVFANGQSTTGGARDIRNNVEVVLLSVPVPGSYLIRIRGTAVNQGTQGYALVATGDIEPGPRPLSLTVVNRPDSTPPGVPVPIQVLVNPGDDALVSESAALFYRFDNGPFSAKPLALVEGFMYSGTLPPPACGDVPEYYVAAEGIVTGPVTSPASGSLAPYSMIVGVDVVLLSDNLEATSGWVAGDPSDNAVSGLWELVDPIGTTYQPEDDKTPDPGSICWITGQHTPGQSAGINDVDGGSTTLFSPIIDLSTGMSPTLSYWRWFYGSSNDTFVVSISNNGGATWTTVETVSGGLGGWQEFTFQPGSLLPLTSQMQLRFVATDVGGGSFVEAGVDDLLVDSFVCEDPALCIGDADGDLDVDFQDIGFILANFGGTGSGDANGDNNVDFQDITAVLASFGGVCN